MWAGKVCLDPWVSTFFDLSLFLLAGTLSSADINCTACRRLFLSKQTGVHGDASQVMCAIWCFRFGGVSPSVFEGRQKRAAAARLWGPPCFECFICSCWGGGAAAG